MTCYAQGRGPCHGPYQPHHLVNQQRIKKALATRLRETRLADPKSYERIVKVTLADTRNIRPFCEHHHAQLTNARWQFTRSELPESVERFAEEQGLGWALEREYGPMEEAA